ncbi:hypothetical protein ACHAWF_010502 [Thalassiosira exigua]
MKRQRSFSQKLSSTFDPLKRQIRPQQSRVASESFIASNASGFYKGQVVGSPSLKRDVRDQHMYLNHDDINRRAIQIFHTEGERRNSKRSAMQCFQRIIHPYDRFRRMFDIATVIWVLLLVFFIPFEIGFVWYEPPQAQKVLFAILDFWFAVDIILNFRTGYVHHGTVVMDSKKIVSNYLSTWFLVDVLGTLPFEQLISGHVSSRKSLKLVKYFKIPKLLRVSRVMKYVRNHKYVYDFSKVLLVIFTLLHVGACVWVVVLDPCDETKANYSGRDVCDQGNVYRVYSEALHISAAMLLGVSNFHIIGKPELINLDFEGRQEDSTTIYLVSTLYMIVGLFLIALLMSETNVYMMGKMQGSAAFQRKTDRVNHEMEYYGVPDDLQRQVRAFYDYVWIHQKQYDEKIALLSDKQMSTDLQRKLALHLFKDVVSHISFFSEIDDLLLGEICMSLRTRIFLPGDMIIFKGDVGKELFIIAKGVVEVLRDDLPANKRRNAPRIQLTNGSFFGEIALVMEVRRTCSVQARTVCEVNILQQDAFDAVVRANPHFARRMNELVVARQLDTCLARTHQKGVDFQVSQTDLDLAVEAMERNMKEGLERRKMNEPCSSTSSSLRGSEDAPSKPYSPMRVSFEVDRAKEPPDSRNSPNATDEESQLGSTLRTRSASEAPVSDVLKDITRRSTRFPDENAVELARRRAADRPLLSDCERIFEDTSDSADVCSDTEVIEASRDQNRLFRRRRSAAAAKKATRTRERSTTTVEDVDSKLTGHFNPGRSVVDIAKVRPVILDNCNNRGEPRRRTGGGGDVHVTSLNARLSLQSKLMEQLMAKIDQLESRTRSSFAKSAGNAAMGENKEK